MLDVARNTLQEGDEVVTTTDHYKDLVRARVIGFTPQKVKLELITKSSSFRKHGDVITKFAHQVCLVIRR